MKNVNDPHDTVPEFLRAASFGHVEGVLDEPPPWLYRKLIPLLSGKVRVDEDVAQRIREAAQMGPVVYAMKYRSLFDLHFLRIRFAKLGLPLPAFVFESSAVESGSLSKIFRVWSSRVSGIWKSRHLCPPLDREAVKDILQHGGAGVMFLVDEKTSRNRYVHPESDPVRVLLDLQGQLAGSITVIPLMILFDRTRRPTIRPFWESFLGDPDRPGPLKRILSAVRQWTIPELLVGEPVHLLGQFEEFGSDRPWEDVPFEVRKDLVAAINDRIRVNRGPERLSRTEVKERVLQDPRVRKAVCEAAGKENVSEEKIRKRAESYVDEIAADQRIQVHHFLYYVLKWLFSTVFSGVDLKESQFSMLKRKNSEGSLILVACHKSHFDYLLTGFFSFVNQMAIPHMAAGKNLSFWPIGPVLRNAGAFFIRRSFKGLNLYAQVFSAYVKVLVREKINVTFYIEGGRSRTGKLLPPKVGMLSFLLQAIDEGAVEDLAFVPTFVAYDQIPEEKSYLKELAGREKTKESVLSVLRARKILAKSFGKAYVRFHEPMSFVEFRELWRRKPEASGSSARESREMAQDFAYHLMRGIVRAGVIIPVDLAAAGLVCTGKGRVSQQTFQEAVDSFSTLLRAEGIEFADSLDRPKDALQAAVGLFAARGFVSLQSVSAEEEHLAAYRINEPTRVNLEFYKNALVNFLWSHSLCATVILKHRDSFSEITPDMREDFRALTRLFAKELIFEPLMSQDALMERAFQLFELNGWISRSAVSPAAVRLEPLEYLRGILGDLLEIYYLVLVAASGEAAGAGQKEFTKHLVKLAGSLRALPDPGTVSLPMVTVKNALSRLAEMGVLDYAQSRRVVGGVADPEGLMREREFLFQMLRGRINDPGEAV